MATALVDICGTLFRSNTTFDFLSWYLHDNVRYQRFCKIRKFRIVGFANHWLHRLTGMDLMRMAALRFLRGRNKEELYAAADKFYEEFLKQITNGEVLKIVEQWRSNGLRLLIASATIDPVAQAVSKALDIPHWQSSILDYDENGICLGRLKEDMLAQKEKMLLLKNEGNDFTCVITDNYSDNDIIGRSEYAVLVQYDGKKNKWNNIIEKSKNTKCKILEI